MDVKTINVDEIGLSRRASNALQRVDIKTVGEMLECTEETLSEIRNMGRKSIDEVLLKIDEYRKYDLEGGFPDPTKLDSRSLTDAPEDFDTWCRTDEGKRFILNWISEKQVKTGDLELLSARAYNYLLLNNIVSLEQIVFLSTDDLMEIPRLDPACAEEIVKICRSWLKDHEAEIFDALKKEQEESACEQEISLRDLLYNRDEHDRILEYVQANDCDVNAAGFSVRAKNLLLKNGLFMLSDFIFISEAKMKELKGMGTGSLQEIQAFIDNYLSRHGDRLKAFCKGDSSVLWDKEVVRKIILDTYNKIGFEGMSLRELREKSRIPDQVPDEMLKDVLGCLLAEGILEYVDFRCYRVYPRFSQYLERCSKLNERTREIIKRRLQGDTLEAIASDFNLTRERVRQIVSKYVKNAKSYFVADTGMEWFDEDYYRYFFETYLVDKKDAEEWLGIDQQVFNYMELTGSERGKKDLEEAVDDYHNLDLGFRLKIKSYLNRNKLFLDGRWIDKSRADLEEYVVRKFCTDNVSFEEFIRIYNDFLREEEVPYDEKLYYTDAVIRTRKNRLTDVRFLLWKQNEQIRYYDIDGQDFTELLDTLNLGAYENIEYSTWKFMRDYPEIMEKYDIRDQYELHNLLRKIVKDGDYNDFHCERTPMIRFGTFDRDGAILDLMVDNAPISQQDLAELVHQEYGYDVLTVMGSYLASLAPYYHHGMYTIDQKVMLPANMEKLLSALTEDFYYIDEIRRLYTKIIPEADVEEVNPYNLKMMGFSVLTRYAYRNYSSLEAYFRDLLTREYITNIIPYRNRYTYVVMFSNTLNKMKKDWEIFEFEPNQIITFRKLEASGITREDLKAFCDDIADFVEDGAYFSVQSIRRRGFESELFEYGFSDWFYASLLTSDDRFSNTRAFNNILLFKGEKRITIQSFEESLIQQYGSIDVYDLMAEMEETYGCQISDRLDLVYKVGGTNIYYDKYMDRLYANNGIYNRELDAVEGA